MSDNVEIINMEEKLKTLHKSPKVTVFRDSGMALPYIEVGTGKLSVTKKGCKLECSRYTISFSVDDVFDADLTRSLIWLKQ